MNTDLQKKVDEKAKSAETLEKQLKTVQANYDKLTRQLTNTVLEVAVEHDPTLRYIAVPVQETEGWNDRLGKDTHVDIACSMKIKDKNLTNVILKNILVAELKRPGDDKKNGVGVSKTTAHLALKPDDATLLINAMGSCKLYFIEASTTATQYTPVIDLRHFKPVVVPRMPKLSLNTLPAPAPMVVKMAVIPKETHKLAIIKGSSQDILEFSR